MKQLSGSNLVNALRRTHLKKDEIPTRVTTMKNGWLGVPALIPTLFLGFVVAGFHGSAAQAQIHHQVALDKGGVTLIASRKRPPRKPRTTHQALPVIACTFVGCIPIPPECHPVTDYGWDGMPTGYDAVQCPNGKLYSRE